MITTHTNIVVNHNDFLEGIVYVFQGANLLNSFFLMRNGKRRLDIDFLP